MNAIIDCLENSNLGEWLNTEYGLKYLDERYYTGTEAYYGKNPHWWSDVTASYGQQPTTVIPEIKSETTTNINLLVNGVPQEQMRFTGPLNNADLLLRSNGTNGG